MQESVINSSTLSRNSYSNNEIIRIRSTYKMDSENRKRKTIFNSSLIELNKNKNYTTYQTKLVRGEMKRFFIEKDIVNGYQKVNILNEVNGKMLKIDYNKFMEDFRRAIERRNEEMQKKSINLCFIENFKYSDYPCILVQSIDMKTPDNYQIIRIIEPEELHRFIYNQFEITGLLLDLYI
ncbi:MAG: hypothetical protein PHT94_00790 [Candidatus Nanoarchaeia archaeon]|nr:hypothetical protein [Candidatus Nanoarchaeia archaeon]